jgi:glycosyltransferase involved in cell wall biosynthesis
MRILIIKNNKLNSKYTACIDTLLQDIGRRQDYLIEHAEHLNNSVTANNVITSVTLGFGSLITSVLQQRRLTTYIKKSKTDLIIQNAVSFIKQKKVPQLFIADDIENLPPVKKISYSKIFLLTYSEAAKQVLADKGYTNIVHVIPFISDSIFQPITWSMQQQVKIDYTEGREYFFTPNNFSSIEGLLSLLKAFSGFKKWQHSSMKLVLTGKLYVPPSDWEEKLNTYKYREDVLVYNKLAEEEKVKLLAGAYACIHLPQNDNDLLPLMQSMQCHTPVITFTTASTSEYAAGAVLAITASNYEELTQQMILIYKDENLRNKLIENCALQAEVYAKEKTMKALQNIIL